MCAASRYLLIGWAVGLVAASIANSTAIGWAAALVAVGALALIGRRFPATCIGGSCAVSGEHEHEHVDAADVEPVEVERRR